MPKQKFFIHNVTFRLLDPEFKKLTQACMRQRKNRSEIIRKLIADNIDQLLKRNSQTD